jgi:ankyrin repeat protein
VKATAFLSAVLLVTLLPAAGRADDLPIVAAARSSNWDAVRALVSQKADVNARAGDGSTALLWASYRDDLQVANLLIRSGASVDAANDLGVTPLWAAAENGAAAMVELLLRAGANPNVPLLSGETPLMTAARVGSAAVVTQLLDRGADPNAREHAHHQTALMWAAAQKHPSVVAVLLAHGADVRARSTSWTEMVKLTTEAVNPGYNTEVRQGGYTALLFAARVGDLESARLLVGAGADVNDKAAYGTSATVVAAHSGHGRLAAFLVERGADPNSADAGYAALHAAIMHRDEQLVRTLLEHGANPNLKLQLSTPVRRESIDYHLPPAAVGATPFWLAARFQAPAIMRLLARGAWRRRALRPPRGVPARVQGGSDHRRADHRAHGGGGHGRPPLPRGRRQPVSGAGDRGLGARGDQGGSGIRCGRQRGEQRRQHRAPHAGGQGLQHRHPLAG